MAGTGRAGITRTKNQAMAARMKANGEERTTGKCPVCYQTVQNAKMQHHMGYECGRTAENRGKKDVA